MNKIDWRIVCVGLVCLTAAEITALLLGYNGTLLKAFLIIVALAIGVTIPSEIIIKFLKGGVKNGRT